MPILNVIIIRKFVEHYYNKYLQERFGINSCITSEDILIIKNKNIIKNDIDLFKEQLKIKKVATIGFYHFDKTENDILPPVNNDPVTPPVVLPLFTYASLAFTITIEAASFQHNDLIGGEDLQYVLLDTVLTTDFTFDNDLGKITFLSATLLPTNILIIPFNKKNGTI